jgi:ureidoglycolate lyase
LIVPVCALNADDFAPFGEVVMLPGRNGVAANGGTAMRFDDAVTLDLTAGHGRPQLSMFRVEPVRLPFRFGMLERHALSSQTFVPFPARRFLVIVAPPGDAPAPGAVRAFVTDGRQGVHYARGVWHHPALALDESTDLVVIGRAAAEIDCDVFAFDTEMVTGLRVSASAG